MWRSGSVPLAISLVRSAMHSIFGRFPLASTGAGVTRNSMEKLIIVTLLVLPRSMSSGGLRSAPL